MRKIKSCIKYPYFPQLYVTEECVFEEIYALRARVLILDKVKFKRTLGNQT